MNLLKKYPILTNLLSPFRRSQQKTVISIIAARCGTSQFFGLCFGFVWSK
jgi:hypothetical protein